MWVLHFFLCFPAAMTQESRYLPSCNTVALEFFIFKPVYERENMENSHLPWNGSDKFLCQNLKVIGIWIFKDMRMNKIIYEENRMRKVAQGTYLKALKSIQAQSTRGKWIWEGHCKWHLEEENQETLISQKPNKKRECHVWPVVWVTNCH